ncbi:MAG: disulfide bond formation protein B [Gammaproteobacteria bacterium]|jgi:disulfide bond formation protein DsbB
MSSVFSLLSRRQFNFAGFAVCASLLAFAYYSQFHLGLEPCPLCIFQRIGVIVLALVFLAGGIFPGRIRAGRIYAVLLALGGLAGAAVSTRHVWIQHLPADQIPVCGPGLSYLVDVLPLFDAIKRAFMGSGQCATVSWRFLGMSMPEWMLVWFLGLGLLGFLWNWKGRQGSPAAG